MQLPACHKHGPNSLHEQCHTRVLSRSLLPSSSRRLWGTPKHHTPCRKRKAQGDGKDKQAVMDVLQSPGGMDRKAKASRQSQPRDRKKSSSAPPVDAKQAARGKVDSVKVKDWGSGRQEDLGELQVESHREFDQDHTKPFYEQLARRLELLQARGMLKVAQPTNVRALPPFEKWSFAEEHYVQYLADQQQVHYMMEASVAEALAVAAATETERRVSPGCRGAFAALQHLGEGAGLDRSLEIAADLNTLAKASELLSPMIELKATRQATVYYKYLSKLSDRCEGDLDDSERETAALRLLANVYAVQVTHLTTGMRIGSAAAEKLNLFKLGALNFYRSYPEGQAEPLQQLMQIVNEAGKGLSPEQQEAVMEELPAAFPKISLLLMPLART